MEIKGTSHHHPHFTDGEGEVQTRGWTCLSPLLSRAVTEPGPDRFPDRHPCSLSPPLHPTSCFKQLSLGAYMAAGRGESQVQITSVSQGAKKEVATLLPSCPQVAQLQKATEYAGRLEPHSEKPPPATESGESYKTVAGPTSLHHVRHHTTLSV